MYVDYIIIQLINSWIFIYAALLYKYSSIFKIYIHILLNWILFDMVIVCFDNYASIYYVLILV
jgi:hypothetical protein